MFISNQNRKLEDRLLRGP